MIYDTPEQKKKRKLIRKAIFVEVVLVLVAGALVFIWLMPYDELYRLFGIEEKPEIIPPPPPAPVVTKKLPQPVVKTAAALPKRPEAAPKVMPPPPKKKVIPRPSLLYSVQVAAFKRMDRARRFLAEISAKGYETYIYQTRDAKNRDWYLVRIGDFSDYAAAHKAMAAFKAKQRRDAVITFVNSLHPVKKGETPPEHQAADSQQPPKDQATEQAATRDAQPPDTSVDAGGAPKGFSVQAGAFISPTNAQNLFEFLTSKGYKAYIRVFADAKGKVWNLVRIGNFPDYPSAKEAALKFRADENMPAVITPMESMAVVPEN